MAGYIGTIPVPQATQNREAFTATSNQTSFATLGYTPGFIDVYLNGVKLAAADYTATNGSDVVLASGAASGDILEVVAFSAFTVADQTFTGTTTAANLTVTGAFTSQGIDDNANAVAITIDSSENVGIGTSSPNSALDVAGEITLKGTSSSFASASQPRLYRSGSSAGSYPFNDFGHLIIQSRGDGANRDIIFATGTAGANKTVIDSSGNLLVGKTSSSGVKMDVLATASDNLVARFENSHATGSYGISVKAGDDSGNYAADFSNKSGTSLMRIRGDGNVGIGTSSPSDDVEISTSADAKGLTIKNAGNNRPYLNFDANRSGAGNNLAHLNFKWNGTEVARIIAVAGSDTTNKDDGHIAFQTASAGSPNEAMRIDSSGNLLVGTTDTDVSNNSGSGRGINLNGGGGIKNANTGTCITSNRLGSDGTITEFRKDSSTVGSIASSSGTFQLVANTNLTYKANIHTFDNAAGSTEYMRLDSSGNLLVGMTSANTNNDGAGIRSDGLIHGKRAGVVGAFNRKTSDGDILQFAKDNSTVGSIGVDGTRPYFASADCGIKLTDAQLLPSDSSGDFSDNAVDIGRSATRFKDLYLSGGVYLGGTGSANKLDDYEEGTFTPSLLFGGAQVGNAYSTQSGTYTKVGNVVTVWIYIYLSTKGTSTGHASVSGLPFAINNSNGVFQPLGDRGRVNTSGRGVSAYISSGSGFPLYSGGFDGTVNQQVNQGSFQNTSEVDIVATYVTNS